MLSILYVMLILSYMLFFCCFVNFSENEMKDGKTYIRKKENLKKKVIGENRLLYFKEKLFQTRLYMYCVSD